MSFVNGSNLNIERGMPELPEVETVRRGFEPALAGARLVRVEARRPDLRFAFPDGFVQRLTGARIERLERRGKYLIAPTDRGESLIMTGRFTVEGQGRLVRPGDFVMAAEPDPKHAHVVFETEPGDVITYHDPRRFGFMGLADSADLDTHPWFAGIGARAALRRLQRRPTGCRFQGSQAGPKTLLLDQRVVAGLGNIYVCEALHRAQITPFKPAGRISWPRVEALVPIIKAVLAEAIEAGRSTLRDYAGADGALGYFQHNFQVYDREGHACPRRDCSGVMARQVQAGRSTFYCPVCQK